MPSSTHEGTHYCTKASVLASLLQPRVIPVRGHKTASPPTDGQNIGLLSTHLPARHSGMFLAQRAVATVGHSSRLGGLGRPYWRLKDPSFSLVSLSGESKQWDPGLGVP